MGSCQCQLLTEAQLHNNAVAAGWIDCSSAFADPVGDSIANTVAVANTGAIGLAFAFAVANTVAIAIAIGLAFAVAFAFALARGACHNRRPARKR
jgi:hypothetical protein